jgi:F-type H+-transporting ATPase subunit delta
MPTGQNIIARPYARAAFEYALAANHLAGWGDFLQFAALVVQEKTVRSWILDPRVSKVTLLETIVAIGKEWVDPAQQNFLHLLIDNHRLAYLPQILVSFAEQKAEHDQSLEVLVKTFSAFDEQQTQTLLQALEQRLKRKVHLQFQVDPALLGGAIIRAGDLVIDGSVRSKLKRLQQSLAFD